jgi:hypothetical protein
MSYGVSKIGLERMTVDVANQLYAKGVAANCFRIDIPVASEGFVANTPGVDRTDWEPSEVAAEGMVWVLRQPLEFSGHLLSMAELREKYGIMKSRAQQPTRTVSPRSIVTGIVADRGETMFEDA